jgi:hypothetical protein
MNGRLARTILQTLTNLEHHVKEAQVIDLLASGGEVAMLGALDLMKHDVQALKALMKHTRESMPDGS